MRTLKAKKLKRAHLSAMTSAVLLAFCGGTAFAQGVPTPDAGQVLRDLNQAPPALAPQAVPLQRIEPAPDAAKATESRAIVRSIVITGNSEIPLAELQPLVAGLVGKEQSVTQLNAAARRITLYYRSKGFAVARGYLPVQDITDGRVTIAVIEGRIASHKIANQSLLSDATASAYLADLKDGDVIRGEQIDRGLLLLQDTPGVSTSRATLQPGASPGTSELLIEVKPGQRVFGNVTTDQYGSRYTGEYRVAGGLNIASPLGLGDLLSFNALTSGSNLNYSRLAYQIPVGSDGLRVGIAYSDLRYKLGREFASLDAFGTANSTTLFAAYPFLRSQFRNLSGTLSYEDKKTVDNVGATATVTPKKTGVASLGLTGNLQDSLWGGGFNSIDLSYISGKLDIQSPTALLIDSLSARTNGSYSKVTYGASRLQRITNDTLVWFALTSQQAGKNLDSSEKFSLGGPSGVRAYPQGEASGDEGYKATIELRQALMPNLQGTLFYDMGTVRINKSTFGPAASNSRNLAGAGIGLNATLALVQLRAALAWRVDGGLPTSLPASQVRTPTVLLQASLAF
ncbi:MAG: ShlB/FhaC/HecB family hemolysin secretion/activation protein [Spirosoma sp.]|nr:ShlB/FhaC/HecB family hemolysin secretion/activation protein [Spirosoma sp.]